MAADVVAAADVAAGGVAADLYEDVVAPVAGGGADAVVVSCSAVVYLVAVDAADTLGFAAHAEAEPASSGVVGFGGFELAAAVAAAVAAAAAADAVCFHSLLEYAVVVPVLIHIGVAAVAAEPLRHFAGGELAAIEVAYFDVAAGPMFVYLAATPE